MELYSSSQMSSFNFLSGQLRLASTKKPCEVFFCSKSTCTHVHMKKGMKNNWEECSLPHGEHCVLYGTSIQLHWGRRVGTDEEAARQADWPDPSTGNLLYLKHLSSSHPCSGAIYFISNPPPACFSLLLWPISPPSGASHTLPSQMLHPASSCFLFFHLSLFLSSNQPFLSEGDDSLISLSPLQTHLLILVFALPFITLHTDIFTLLH